MHVYQIVHLTNFLTFSRINIYQNLRKKEKILEKLKGCTYKITHMSVASYTILKLKPSTNFYLSVFFFLFNVFLYIREYANEIICIFIIWSTSYISTFNLVPCLVVQDIWQLKYKLCCRSNHSSFLPFLTYSFYVFFNIREYEN